MARAKFCRDCKFYEGEGRCAVNFHIALADPLSGEKVENQIMSASQMRFGGFCGLEGSFWQVDVSDAVKGLRDSIK